MNYTNNEINALLSEELKNCIAPISGILVAAAIVTDTAVYFGHNVEKENPTLFEHAETMALTRMLKNEKNPKINSIIMAGGGKVDKYKFYTPCYPCCVTLIPYIDSNAAIILLPLPGINHGLEITFGELLTSYGQLAYSKFKSTKKPELSREIRQKTVLIEKDVQFISDLTLLGIAEKILFYLTGSASGRGGVSTMLNEKTNQRYRDIDIIAVIPSGFESVKKKIEDLLRRHYGIFVEEEKSVPTHHNKKGVVFKKCFYYCGLHKDTLIDFTFSIDLIGTLAKNEYEVKNWFHQLS